MWGVKGQYTVGLRLVTRVSCWAYAVPPKEGRDIRPDISENAQGCSALTVLTLRYISGLICHVKMFHGSIHSRGHMDPVCPVSFVVFPHAKLQRALRIAFPTTALDFWSCRGKSNPAVLSGASRDICLALY
ncbi:hypothetical protein GOODEAATRI_018244 [Goodea atripinnis]|uniref:Uncharacterized protein n=1 Tax=Goodea atripinnis TaxID=208336 RepID=A0ABV0PZ14_9TELE